MPQFHIYMGKGGVGKSTCSAISAVDFMRFRVSEGGKVLLDSLDPAHNLHDIFKCSLGKKEKKVFDSLYVRESDIKKKSKEYIKTIETTLKSTYHYQQSLNIEKYFSLLKHAPGTEEYASLLALEDCFNETGFDDVVIDTPPTALTLKTIALSKLNLEWIKALSSMRKEIIDKTNGISKIKKENLRVVEDDPIYNRLKKMRIRYESLYKKLSDEELTEFVLILNEDELSVSESLYIQKQMNELGLKIHRIIINKVGMYEKSNLEKKIEVAIPSTSIQKLPFESSSIIGEFMLKECCKKLV